MNNRIMAIDDEQDFLDSVRRGLTTANFDEILLEKSPLKAIDFFKQEGVVDIALIDITMPEMSGMELLESVKKLSPETECIMVTAVNDVNIAVECMKRGAYDYLLKPVSRDHLILTINRALERKRLLKIADLGKHETTLELRNPEAFKPIVTSSPQIIRLLREAELHAASDVPVLISGETGTGKELLAQAIHKVSRRAKFPFTPVNMASLTPNLFDAEFFGHTKGAFTGAEKDRTGYLEHTHQGTIFLDEVGTLTQELQGKLLRVLEEREYFKLGSSVPQRADLRFIAATNEDLERLVKSGLFRKDLYYRLKGAWIHLPPLRERKEDLPPLIQAFLKELSESSKKISIQREALDLLMEYDYPGNIRELKSLIQSAINLSQGKDISFKYLPSYIKTRIKGSKKVIPGGSNIIMPLSAVEKAHILSVYKDSEKNKSKTAELLGIGLNTLRRKLKTYGAE